MFNEIEKCNSESPSSIRSVKTRDKLFIRKKQLEDELRHIEEAVSLFDNHPYLAQALDLLGKIRL